MQAQVPAPRPAPARTDTSKVKRPAVDTAAVRRAAAARAKARTDSIKAKATADSIKSKAVADSIKAKTAPGAVVPKIDSLQPSVDTTKARVDSLKPPSDSLARDTLRTRRDSIRADSVERENQRILADQKRRADTIKPPTPAAEMPVLTDLDGGYRWGRNELAASGAMTLGDLLEGIPGLTIFRSGWLGSPQVGAMLGDMQKVRVLYDGIELDPIDPRNGGMLDLSFVQLWQLEEVRIERGASEIRVHLRSWRVRSTTPSTRVDIGTGDLETNGYRGYYGRRLSNGGVLQLGANQIGTRDNRGAGDVDGLSLFGRVGWAKGRFSGDASFTRTARDRTEQLRAIEEGTAARPNLPAFDGSVTESYARLGYADTTLGTWAQLTAARLALTENNLGFKETVPIPFKPTPSELTPSLKQLVAAGGWGRGPLAFSITGRARRIDSVTFYAPSARLSFETPRAAISAFAEQQGERKIRRMEVSARLLPLSWFGLSGAVSRDAPTEAALFPTSLTYRGEVGVRIHNAWLSGGVMSRDTARLVAPIVFDTGFTSTSAGAITGTFLSLRGKVWKDVGFDATAIKWDSAGSFRPGYQTRTQLYVNTGWLSRFPSGNFNVLLAVTHEYRTQAYFPLGDEVLTASQYRTINAQLEIRLLQATLSYQFRNMLNEQYQQIPGFFMHRPVQYYGVRWNFYN